MNSHKQPCYEEALDALQAIPPDLTRDEWHKAGRAAIAAGLTIDDLVEWSRSAHNFKSEQDVRAAFRTITPEGGTGPGTLFRLAKDWGWVQPTRPGQPPVAYGLMAMAEKLAQRSQPVPPPPRKTPSMSATEVWERCIPATDAHPYIVAKAGLAEGLRVVPEGDPLTSEIRNVAGALVLPLRRPDGTLTSLTFILPPDKSGKATKLNLKNARQSDGRLVVGQLSPGGLAYLCEGIGQAWACHQATGCAAVVCFSWGRVRTVAESIRQQDSAVRLVLVPDVGKEDEAEKLAQTVGAAVARMPQGWPTNSDVNDLAQRDGMEALAQILTAVPPESELHPLARFVDYGMEPKPPRFIIPDLVDYGVVTFAGGHGVGKTSTLMPLAMVAAGLHHPNDPLAPREWRHVIYVCEDVAQAQRIISGIVKHGRLGLDEATVRARFHLVEARRLPPEIVAQVGAVYRSEFTRTARGVELAPLVVLDTNAAVLDLDDSNANSEISRAMAQLKQSFSGLPVWLVCHVSKAVKNRTDTSELSALGGVAFEADSVQNLYLVKEDKSDLRYLVTGKCRFEKRWPEMEIHSHNENVMVTDEFGQVVALTLRWNTVHPPEKSRKEAAHEAQEEVRKAEEADLRDEIRNMVQTAWQRGFPLNKQAVKDGVKRKRSTVTECLESLLAEVWLYEVTVPKEIRDHPRRSTFLVNLSTEEHEAVLRGEGLPPEKLKVPEKWCKTAIPSVPTISQPMEVNKAA
jgi:hypothetical protein